MDVVDRNTSLPVQNKQAVRPRPQVRFTFAQQHSNKNQVTCKLLFCRYTDITDQHNVHGSKTTCEQVDRTSVSLISYSEELCVVKKSELLIF